jgi:hypothetical protein
MHNTKTKNFNFIEYSYFFLSFRKLSYILKYPLYEQSMEFKLSKMIFVTLTLNLSIFFICLLRYVTHI